MSSIFYCLIDSGEDELPDGSMERRWLIDKKVVLHNLSVWVFTKTGPVKNWKPVDIDCWSPKKIEDMPWAQSKRPVVSDRIRAILERMAPRQTQFLPVRLLFKKKRVPTPHDYWIANWLREEDCADRRRSIWMPMEDDGQEDEPVIVDPIIDSRRMRPSTRVCFVEQTLGPVVLLHRDIRAEFDRAGITGPHYLEVDDLAVKNSPGRRR